MKNMLLAATAVGAALAGTLLYVRKKDNPKQISKGGSLGQIALPDRQQHVMG